MRYFTVLIATIVFSSAAFAADEHRHEDQTQHQHSQKIIKPGSKKFEGDAPLQSHMRAIRDDLQSQLQQVHNGKFSEADYKTLAEKVDKSVQQIFKDCKLKPDADAALHSILAKIMSGSANMKKGPTSEARAKGFLEIAKGLESYPQTFKDSTWKPLSH